MGADLLHLESRASCFMCRHSVLKMPKVRMGEGEKIAYELTAC